MKKLNPLVICNGELPSKKIVKKIVQNHNYILCADGGANLAKSLKIKANIIIGDFDSISKSTKKYFEKIPQIKITEQESTDLEKVLNYLLSQKIYYATIIGATGKRIDHTLANFSILLKFQKRGMKIKIIENDFEIFLCVDNFSTKTKVGKIISIVPLVESKNILTRGLKYPLKNETLAPGKREGVSNVAIKNKISISLKSGALIILFKN